MTDPPDQVVPPTAAVGTDSRCVGCGYNVRGLSVDTTCPECGSLVSEAVRISAWLNQGRVRGRLIAGLCLFTFASLFAWYLVGGSSGTVGSNIATLAFFPFTLVGTLWIIVLSIFTRGFSDGPNMTAMQGVLLPMLPLLTGLTLLLLPQARRVMFPAEAPRGDVVSLARSTTNLRRLLGITCLCCAVLAILGAMEQAWVNLPFGLCVLAIVPALWIIANDLDALCRYAGWQRLRSCIRVQRWAFVLNAALAAVFIFLVTLDAAGISLFETAHLFGPVDEPYLRFGPSWHPPLTAEFEVTVAPRSDLDLYLAIAGLGLGLMLLVTSIVSLIALPVTLVKMRRVGWA